MGVTFIFEVVVVGDLLCEALLSTISVPSLSMKKKTESRVEPCSCAGTSVDSHSLNYTGNFSFLYIPMKFRHRQNSNIVMAQSQILARGMSNK